MAAPSDPVLDEIQAVMPLAYREMRGRIQAWTRQLVLTCTEGRVPVQVTAIHAQIDGWRRRIWDGAPQAMPH